MNTVFDPTILFITESEWHNSEKRDGFLDHLSQNLKYIYDFSITKVYWTNELEELLWNDPCFPPWRKEIDWKNKIVPVFYNRLQSCRVFVNLSTSIIGCSVRPQITFKSCKLEASYLFMRLMNHVLTSGEEIFLCVGIENQLLGNQKYIFFNECNSHQLVPELINVPEDWLKHVKVVQTFWPRLYSKEELEKFQTALDITAKLVFLKDMNKSFLYEFEFAKPFIEALANELNNREEILSALVKRLMPPSSDTVIPIHL